MRSGRYPQNIFVRMGAGDMKGVDVYLGDRTLRKKPFFLPGASTAASISMVE